MLQWTSCSMSLRAHSEMQHFRYSINQSMFYFMSFHIEVILDNNQKIIIFYTNLPTGLCTINLTIEIKISVLYKMSLTLLQSLKPYPFFWNISMVIGHSSSMCLTDRTFLQTHVTFCEYLVFHEFRRNLDVPLLNILNKKVFKKTKQRRRLHHVYNGLLA